MSSWVLVWTGQLPAVSKPSLSCIFQRRYHPNACTEPRVLPLTQNHTCAHDPLSKQFRVPETQEGKRAESLIHHGKHEVKVNLWEIWVGMGLICPQSGWDGSGVELLGLEGRVGSDGISLKQSALVQLY